VSAFSEKYQDIYGNPERPEEEKLHVFVNANRISERISPTEPFVVAELGFGYGINYALTVKTARQVGCESSLVYFSCDEDPRGAAGKAHLWQGDVADFLANAQFRADVWYFDGFSPAKNPAMWSAEVFSRAFQLTKPGGTFSTYTAAGWVRRNIESAGFVVTKKPGFGAKREMLVGHRPA